MNFSEVLEGFTGKKILVVGDLMLDKHIHGNVSRISPEAPVPVLKAEKETFNPGGAANVASNLVTLGAKVYLSGGGGDVDAVILSDYAKGTLTENLVKNIISLAKENNKLVTADCKPINIEFYKNVSLLKPNKKEAIEMTLKDNVEEAGRKLLEMTQSNILITRGGEGMSLFFDNEIVNIPSKANKAAAIVIEKPGVVPIHLDDLKKEHSSNIKVVEKAWGEEEWLVNTEKYCGKRMLIRKNYYCSYHKHKIKEETFYVLNGELEIIKGKVYYVVKSGETFHVKPEEYHSFRALEDTTFFEFSTHHSDEDNYRLTQSGNGEHEQWKKEIEGAIIKNG